MENIHHKILNAYKMKERRIDLRRRSTATENLLWQELRNNKLGLRFKRQYSVMNYVVDFYCPKVKLAIELDGEIHKFSQKYDKYRTRYLESLGIREIRFTNKQIVKELKSILNKIKLSLS